MEKESKKVVMKNLLVGMIGGVIALSGGIGFQVVREGLAMIRPSASSTSTSNVNYRVNTDVTSAVNTVSDAVVSVLSYQEGRSSSLSESFQNIFGDSGVFQDIFGGENGSDGELRLSGEGSGVIYKKSDNDAEAYVVTNNHVISGASQVEVLMSNGQKVAATVVGKDSFSDLAVLKIDGKDVKKVASFGDSSKLQVGEPAIAVGSPLGSQFANTATEGIISSLARQVSYQNDEGQTSNINALQTDAAINPGNSGGALINIKGQVIGITSSKVSSTGTDSVEGMGFAIPSNDVITIINKLEKDGNVVRPALGINAVPLSDLPQRTIDESLDIPDSVTSGLVISSIQEGFPADTAGLKRYDVITKIDDSDVSSTAALQSALYKHNVGEHVDVTYYRDGKQETVSIHLTADSSQVIDRQNNNN